MPAVPKPVRKPRRAAAVKGQDFENYSAEKLDRVWQIIARAQGIPPDEIGHIRRRKKDPTLGYAVTQGDIDAPVHFPLILECKSRPLPKTLMRYYRQAEGYDSVRIPGVLVGDEYEDMIWMRARDFLGLWTEGWIAAGEAQYEANRLREAAAPMVAALSFLAVEDAVELPGYNDIQNFLATFGGHTDKEGERGQVGRDPFESKAEVPQ